MRLRLGRLLGLASLMFSLQFLNVGCSSSSSGEGQGEEVAANEEEAATDNNAAEEDNQAAVNNEANNGAEVNGAEGNGLNAEADGNQINNPQGAENNNQLGAENGGLNGADNALAENNQGQGAQAGEEDLQQIINEMNTANTQLPGNNNMAAQDMGNSAAGNMAMDAPMNAAGNQASSVPTDAPPAGGAVSGSPAGPGLPEMGSKMAYIVQRGDTLAKIAMRIYGDTNKWTEIANFTGLANPRLIYPGDVVYYQLTEQSTQFAASYESVKRSEVQIQQGDTLATIAARVFGNSSLWKLIWRQNDGIDNPDRLTAGTTLYYVDPSSMASMDPESEQKFVDIKTDNSTRTKASGGSLLSATKVKASKTVLEVANDSLNDLFSQTVSKDLLKRT